MSEENLNYFSKADCIKRGLIRLSTGGYYKLCALEKYARKGLLDGTMYDVSELLLAGAYLHKDFIDGEIGKVATTDYEKVRVDCSPMNGYSEKIINARIKYYKAIRMIPREFQSVVRKVCCDDEEVLIYGGKWKKQQLKYHAVEMLKFGLCRLVRYYRRIKRY